MIRIGIAGLIGYEAAEKLLNNNLSVLEKRFSGRFIREFRALSLRNIEEEEIEKIIKTDCGNSNEEISEIMLGYSVYIGRITEGGLWAALWKACDCWQNNEQNIKKTYSGCKISLKDIYIRQEVIEISELYDENPYETASGGAFLLVWDEDRLKTASEEVKRLVNRAGVIGYMTAEKQRVITDGEITRFLTPPGRQKKDITDRRSYSSKL